MQLIEDARYAMRQFSKAPGFTITAVLTLALGIGATTAIFTLVHAVLLKSLPVAKPGELYRIGSEDDCCVTGGLQQDWKLFSYELYKTFRDGTEGFAELAAFQSGQNLVAARRAGSDHPAESMVGEYVSGNYFSLFGIGAYAGRVLSPQDDHKGAAPVAVMNYRTWVQKYGQDPSIAGAAFSFNGKSFTVVGIAPPGFFGDRLETNPPAFWFPLTAEPLLTTSTALLDQPHLNYLDLMGRIQPGSDVKQIEAQMKVELQQWLSSPVAELKTEEQVLIPKQTLRFAPGGSGVRMMQDEYREGLHLLMLISGFVLLIACANVANLMLVRATTRRQQTSIRAALGASRSRQIRQVLTESTLLALLGAIAGIGLAYGGTRLILHLAFQKSYVPIQASPSLPVLGFTFLVSLLTGVLFGVAPAWITANADPADALRGANRSTAQGGSWTQKSLVVLQAALSLVLLCAAGLLTQSLRNLHNQHFGFETPNRYLLHVDPQMAGYKPDQLEALYRQLRASLAAVPGIKQVSYSLYMPMEGNNWGETVYLEGQAPPPPDSNENEASWVRVSDQYFDLIGTKVVEGRAISEQDTRATRPVAMVNRTFEKKFFKGENALGKHFGNLDAKYSGKFEIVGVTEDTQYRGPKRKIPPMFFLPAAQRMSYELPQENRFEDANHYLDSIELETVGPLQGLEPQVRQAMAQVNPNLAVIDFTSFVDTVEANFSQQEMIVKLTSLFGFLALVLASIGLYGVTAYSVERRTSEIGIRMALGADRMNVLKLVLRGAFLQIGIGLLIGIPVTILGGRAMATQLFGVKPYDPGILLLTTAVLSFAALVASVIPARRAASIEPMRALRSE
ncbi:MAG TPA: ABC transporter permease [Terriglobales bacterium]|nr:ABC transporter permease [Terriglobales bacterium]